MNNLEEFNKSIIGATKALTNPNPTDKFLIWYHASWCGHCVRMREEWDAMKKQMKKKKNLHIMEIESDALNHLKSHHKEHPLTVISKDLDGYPFVIHVGKGKGKSDDDEKFYGISYNNWFSDKQEYFRTAKSFAKFAEQ